MKGAKIVWVGKVVSNMWRGESDHTLAMLREDHIIALSSTINAYWVTYKHNSIH